MTAKEAAVALKKAWQEGLYTEEELYVIHQFFFAHPTFQKWLMAIVFLPMGLCYTVLAGVCTLSLRSQLRDFLKDFRSKWPNG